MQNPVIILPEPFRPEHASRLSERLSRFWTDGIPSETLPHFAAEVTPPLEERFALFRSAFALQEASGGHPTDEVRTAFADAVQAVGCRGILLLLGQRLTSASLTDTRAIPPTRAELLEAGDRLHGPGSTLTVCARALAKHAHRSVDAFWGVASGPESSRNASARATLESLIDNATWWNTFGHFAHEIAFEVRVPAGHGARWTLPLADPGGGFVGFLEPFDETKCPSLREQG